MEEEGGGANKELEQQKMLAQLKASLRIVLEDSAYERMMKVFLANQQLFAAGSQKCIMLFQRVQRKITDREVLMILKSLKAGERGSSGSISIVRK